MTADNGASRRDNSGSLLASGDQGPRLAPALASSAGSYSVPGVGLINDIFIIRALVLRVLRVKYRDSPLGLLMEFFRIAIVIIAHYVLFYVRNKPMPGHVPIEVFVIAAFSVFYAFLGSIRAAEGSGKVPSAATPVPGVSPMHMRLANLAWAWLSYFLFCLISAVVLNLCGDGVNYPDVALSTSVFVIAVGLGFGYGLVTEGLAHLWPVVRAVAHVAQWALFVTSGIYFSLSQVPAIEGSVYWYNPVLHLTEYERHAFDSAYPIALVTLLYPSICAALLLFIGLILDRSLRRLHHR